MSPIQEIEVLSDLIEQKFRDRLTPIHPAATLPPPPSTSWNALLPALLKRLIAVKNRAGNPRALARYLLLDERDPRAVAQALYLFGDCQYFAAAVAERYGLRDKIRHVVTGPFPGGHRHIVVQVDPDQYLDYGGIHCETDLKADYLDAISGREAALVQDRALDPRPTDVPEAFDLARQALIEREKEADFGIRLYGW